MTKTFDAVVVGAGVFGAWTALHLRRSGRTVALLDAYGAGNNRSSSGGESRILRWATERMRSILAGPCGRASCGWKCSSKSGGRNCSNNTGVLCDASAG